MDDHAAGRGVLLVVDITLETLEVLGLLVLHQSLIFVKPAVAVVAP